MYTLEERYHKEGNCGVKHVHVDKRWMEGLKVEGQVYGKI